MCRPYVHVANESTLRPRPHEYFRSRIDPTGLVNSCGRVRPLPHEFVYAETVSLLVICVNTVSGFNRLFGYVYDRKIL